MSTLKHRFSNLAQGIRPLRLGLSESCGFGSPAPSETSMAGSGITRLRNFECGAEEIESVDMMRVLEHGYKIACVESHEESYPVDVPEDVVRVEKALKDCSLLKRYVK